MDFYATLGPACASEESLRALLQAGMTGIRLNLSHGPLAQHADWLALCQKVGVRQILIDLQGPELRLGRLESPVAVNCEEKLVLGLGGLPCPSQLILAAREGDTLLVDDGKLQLRVETAGPDRLYCRVERGGVLQSRKSIAAPGLCINMPTLTQQDLENLRLAPRLGVTGVMLPFVRGGQDLLTLRKALRESGAEKVLVFAKIENTQGVEKLDEILPYTDQLVIARGDLGNAMPLWQLPGCQKRLAARCRAQKVPFMVVTQMLDSMCRQAVPTRAEVCDIYNAVLDGAESLMLTGETAVGNFPVKAMEYLVKTAHCAVQDMQRG